MKTKLASTELYAKFKTSHNGHTLIGQLKRWIMLSNETRKDILFACLSAGETV